MTTNQTTNPSVFLDATAVLDGPLPVEISMEPILQGAPFAYERVLYDAAGTFFAVWACDAGIYPRVKDKRGSFMYIISGEATITDEDGTSHELTAGSVIVLPYGWVGAWDIRETIRKVYLHTTPVPPYRAGVQPSAFLAAADVLERDLPVPVSTGGAAWAPPVAETVVFDGADGRCAVQEHGPGVFRRAAAEGASYLYVISGEATVTDADGTTHELTAGSAVALPDGWAGTWDIRTPIRTVHVDTAPIADK
ncbi:cupin domain-containing protein [Micromonospora sp. NPDC047738]|uniref:cupin domain-containing protein n=1 Tax=unclassified Micromonospora TaxID=2617518 RepID=UPI0033FF520E